MKCAGFNVSRPVMYSRQAGKRSVSYINQIYKKFDSNGSESYTAKVKMDGVLKFYGETAWGNFDDFLAGKIIDSDWKCWFLCVFYIFWSKCPHS